MKKKLMGLGLTMAMVISLAGCGGSGDSNNSNDDASPAEETSAPEATTAAQPTDLTGTWQSEDNDGSYQEAIITDNTIEINWVSDGTESIYWIGTYIAPTEAVDEYSWTSERDKEKTDSALLASTDDTKDFTYKNDTISYEASALGTTTTMELKKVSDDTPGAAAEDTEAAATTTVDQINLDNSEGTLTYTMHELSEDYDGNPAIIVYFDYTNKKDDTSFAQATFYPQVFQNGVECEMGISLDDNEAISNASKEIQKGTTLNVAYIYTLQDTESPVTLKVTDQSSENLLNDVYQEQELSLK